MFHMGYMSYIFYLFHFWDLFTCVCVLSNRIVFANIDEDRMIFSGMCFFVFTIAFTFDTAWAEHCSVDYEFLFLSQAIYLSIYLYVYI